MPTDDLTPDKATAALSNAVDAEEYEIAGRKLKRAGVSDLKRLRDDLVGEDNVRTKGNVLERAGHVTVRRG